jgi:hypothetical protein
MVFVLLGGDSHRVGRCFVSAILWALHWLSKKEPAYLDPIRNSIQNLRGVGQKTIGERSLFAQKQAKPC